MKAIVFGSTGLVGEILVNKLIPLYNEIICPVRKNISPSHPKQNIINVNFADLNYTSNFFQVDDLYYCIGTTIKKSGSIQKFIETEIGLAQNIFSLAKKNGVKRVFLISSQGANHKSHFPYLKTKGEIENIVSSFHFESTIILRPSLLIGDREEKRSLEGIMQKLTKPIIEPLQNYIPQFSPILADQVANAMVNLARKKTDKLNVLENAEIIEDSLN
jgi:uncharacterized protein YbjT (DUF2867 family)